MIIIGVEEVNALNDVYKELVDLIGYDNTMVLYTYYKGQQITFPVKLFNPDCICDMIKQQYDGTNAKKLARNFGYSERWIREMVKKG